MKPILMAALLALLQAIAAAAHAASPADDGAALGASVDSLIAFALKNNPGLAAAALDIDAARERVTPAGALPDPAVKGELPFRSEMRGGDSLLTGLVKRIQLSQTFPLWGKRDLRRGIAKAEVDEARAQQAAARAALIGNIKAGYLQYVLLTRSKELNLEILDLLRQTEQIALERYAQGRGRQQDIIRARTQSTQLQGELAMQENSLRQVRARINALLGRRVSAPLAEPQQPHVVSPSAERIYVWLAQRLHATNPALATQRARIRAAELRKELADKNRYPDLTVGISFLQAMVELINIPLQQESRRAQIREAAIVASAEKARKDEMRNHLFADLIEHLSALSAGDAVIALNRNELEPQAKLNFETSALEYDTSGADFNTLLEAQITLRKLRLERLKADNDQQIHLAAIERLLGESL